MAELNNVPAVGMAGELLQNYQATGEAVPNEEIEQTVQIPPQKTTPVMRSGSDFRIQPLEEELSPSGYRYAGIGGAEDLTEEALANQFGRSRYDIDFYRGMDVEQQRAVNQSDFSKIGTGFGKMMGTAASVLADTVVGTIAGAIAGGAELVGEITNPEKDFSVTNILSSALNNPVSVWLNDFKDTMEEWMPNYRTERERTDKYQREWYKPSNWNANFIGDNILKNFGFTLGAMGGGMIMTELLGLGMSKKFGSDILKTAVVASEGNAEAANALKGAAQVINSGRVATVNAEQLANNISNAAKTINKSNVLMQLFGSTVGAIGEGRIEGLMAQKEFLEDINAKIDNEYQQEYAGLRDELLNSGNKDWVQVQVVRMPDGSTRDVKTLTEAGERHLVTLQRNCNEKYADMKLQARELSENVANTTFMFNLPVLTASNWVEFGKMFAGGWKTSRANLRTVNGKLNLAQEAAENRMRPVLNGKLTGSGNKALTALGISAKVGLTEGSEEMIQGYISSGSKKVAENKLTNFNDDAYDPDSISAYQQWVNGLQSFKEGGREYLRDFTNWQEGALGLLTGLVGVPGQVWRKGQRWQGGVPGAIRDANNKVNMNRAAAEAVNSRINDKEFYNRWEGYIRGLKYQEEMDKAAAKNDEYAWHNAEDKRMISDVIAFADAGRLDDLNSLIDAYGKMTESDAANIKSAMKGNPNVNNISADKLVGEVKKRAGKIKEVINNYSATYDDLSARAPLNASPEFLKELLFTTNQIKQLESRFLEMYKEVTTAARAALGGNPELSKQNVDNQLTWLESFFSSVIPQAWTKAMSAEIDSNLNVLKEQLASVGNTEMVKKVDDMKKLANDRREFYQKLQTLQTPEGQQRFEEQKQTPEKVQKKELQNQISTEADFYSSVEDVRNAYHALRRDQKLHQEFFETLEKKADDNPAISEFLNIYNTYEDFKDSYSQSQYKIPASKMAASTVMDRVIDEMLDLANTEDQLTSFNLGLESQKDAAGNELNETAKRIKDQSYAILKNSGPEDMVSAMIDAGYDEAVSAARNAMAEYTNNRTRVGGKNAASQRQANKANAKPNDRPATLAELVAQKEGKPVPQKSAPAQPQQQPAPQPVKSSIQVKPGQKEKDTLGREWTSGQTVYLYQLDANGEVAPIMNGEFIITDFFTSNGVTNARLAPSDGSDGRVLVNLNDKSVIKMQTRKMDDMQGSLNDKFTPVANLTPKEVGGEMANDNVDVPIITRGAEQELENEKQSGMRTYLRTGMPELDNINTMAPMRKIKSQLKNRTITEKSAKEHMSKLDFRDIYLTDGNEGFKDTFLALQDYKQAGWEQSQNAFENVALRLQTGDKIKFVIDPEFQKYNGHDQILMFVEKNGKDYILSTLPEQESKYEGLEDLRAKIFEKYNAWTKTDEQPVFTFRDSDGNQITTTVYAKMYGVVTYDKNEAKKGYVNERPINEDHAFDADAPIVLIDGSGQQVQLSGVNYNSAYLGGLAAKRDTTGNPTNAGHLYYLAKGEKDYSIPIRLNIEHYNVNNMSDGRKTFQDINDTIKKMSTFLQKAARERDRDIKDIRAEFKDIVTDLSSQLAFGHNFFAVFRNNDGTLVMRVYNSEANRWRDKIYAADADFNTLASYIAENNYAISVSDKNKMAQLINDGILTTNATALRPKGVDFRAYRWDGSAFTPTTPVQTNMVDSAKQKAKDENATVKQLTEEEKKKAAEAIDKKVAEAVQSVEKPKGGNETVMKETIDQTKEQAPVYKTWNEIPEDLRKDMEAAGYSQEDFDDPSVSDDDRAQMLKCGPTA